MPLNEHFIPGQWIDTIDVNDFVILNKKPFLNEPFFLKTTSTDSTNQHLHAIQSTLSTYEFEIDLSFPLLENEEIPWLHQNFSKNPFQKKIGYSENLQAMQAFYGLPRSTARAATRKTMDQLFQEIATREAQKMMKSSLFTTTPTTYAPAMVQPDVRMVVLYGTKELLKEKKWALLTLDKHLQTHTWMQRRMSLHREMDAIKQFERFATKQGVDVTQPATNATQACKQAVVALAACMMENPSIPFSLHQLLPFLDIYIEYDLQTGVLPSEEAAQALVDELYGHLAFIRFSYAPGLRTQHQGDPVFFGETFGGSQITKTTYRFLHALRTYRLYPFAIRVAWHNDLPAPFQAYMETLLAEGLPISFYAMPHYYRHETIAFQAYGLHGTPGEDVFLQAGTCDLEKVLYVTLNGGKDVHTQTQFQAITQPFRTDHFGYDDVVDKWKEVVAYVLNTFVEISNTVLYLQDVHQVHPFRSALLQYRYYYHVQFGFFNLEKTARLLSAIYEEKFTVQRDQKGWITAIIPAEDTESNEAIVAFLAEYIRQEINKIPLYQNGRAHVKMYYNEPRETITDENLVDKPIIPAEMTEVVFHANVHVSPTTKLAPFLRTQFERGFRELHVYTDPSHLVIDGVVYHLKE